MSAYDVLINFKMKELSKQKRIARKRRAARVRAKIFGTSQRPRLSIFRSNKHLYLQLIDDTSGKTLVSASDLGLDEKGQKSEVAHRAGKLLAQKAQLAKIEQVVFDRRGYQYHGRVKVAAEGAREGGLKF